MVDGFDATQKLARVLDICKFVAVIFSRTYFMGFSLIVDHNVIRKKFKHQGENLTPARVK
jgi:hypothetical protein